MSANAIAVQHDGQEQLLGSRFNDRIVRVPNLVSSISSKQREFSKTIYDAVWIAQIRPVKQLGRFLDVVEASPDLRFAVVGGHDPMTGSDDYTMLNKRMTELNNLQYLGPLRAEEVSAVLAQSRTLVNTSQAEGFPNTMLEAWSLGIPVVSLSVDPGEVIRREKLGIVSGSVANLPHDVHALARNEALNRECGHNGLNYVRRRHSLTAVCEALAVAAPGSTLLPNAPEFPDALSEA
jgi:glycosyltransferase involved in cell wall biosynthesis